MATKPYLTCEEQVSLLRDRGMDVEPRQEALLILRRANYYRLSGCWYPFRQPASSGRGDRFVAGARLEDVWALHQFDASLRSAAFAALGRIEGFLRARLAHELGAVDPCAHLRPDLLVPEARGHPGEQQHRRWLAKYDKAVAESREDFVEHHRTTKGGVLPVWVAVEVLDWGSLTWLYRFAPRPVQDAVAQDFLLNGPQLASWLRSLNIVRNVCAHHGRLFNKVHTIKPKMPARGAAPDLDEVRDHIVTIGSDPTGEDYSEHWFGERTFGQLTLTQHLLTTAHLDGVGDLPAVLSMFPDLELMTIAALGAPAHWDRLRLWQ